MEAGLSSLPGIASSKIPGHFTGHVLNQGACPGGLGSFPGPDVDVGTNFIDLSCRQGTSVRQGALEPIREAVADVVAAVRAR